MGQIHQQWERKMQFTLLILQKTLTQWNSSNRTFYSYRKAAMTKKE